MRTAKKFNRLVYTTLALTIALMANSVCQAGLREGIAAYDRGDYKTSLNEFRILAEQGDAVAQYNLGVMYYKGKGVSKDTMEAVKWYLKAAEQGHTKAQNDLGFAYAKGGGVPIDYTEAVKWYLKAAEQGDAVAQYNLGVMYANGWGVREDFIQAYSWVNLAAIQGHKNGIKLNEVLRKRMTTSQIAEAQNLSRTLFERIHGK